MAHWKAELAAAEAAEWKRLNAGWDKGMPAEVEGVKVKGKQPKAMNVAGWDELAWCERDGGKVGAPAPAAAQSARMPVPYRAERQGVAWEKAAEPRLVPVGDGLPLPAMKQVESELSVAEQWAKARVLRMPRGQKLAPCTWVLGDARGKQQLLWAERQKQVCQRRSGEKGARVLEAALGWKSRSADVQAAGRALRGKELVKQVSEEELADVKPSPLERMAAQEELAWLLKALSPRQREAVVLKAEGLSRSEMAEAMGCSEKGVKKALEEGRAKARKLPAKSQSRSERVVKMQRRCARAWAVAPVSPPKLKLSSPEAWLAQQAARAQKGL